MPALDPLSAASRPFDQLPSVSHGQRPPRHYIDQLPNDLPEPLYGHRRVSSVSQSEFSAVAVTGSDEWMKDKVAECLDKASCILDFT